MNDGKIKNRYPWWNKKVTFIFVGAILLRLLLMPITLHPDLLGHSFSAYFLADEGKINLYETLANLPASHPLVKNFGVSDIFIYPPLANYTLAFFRVLVKPFSDPGFIPWLWENLSQIHSYPHLYKQLFLFKVPYFFIDISAAFLLAGLFKDLKQKRQAFVLWLLNPLAIYVSFMVGQLDLLPTFFTILALYFFQKSKYNWSVFSLGVAASYKLYPLFLLPALVFIAKDKLWPRVKLMAVGISPFIFFIAPYINSKAFRAMVFSPKSQKMLFMGWPVSGAEVIYPFILGIFGIYFLAYYTKKTRSLAVYFLAVLLLTFSVTHFHPQWFLWVTPFLIWDLIKNNFKNALLSISIFTCWLVLTFLFEPSLSFGLFNPVWPDMEMANGLSEVLSKYTDVFQLKSMIRSVLAGTSLFFVYRIFNISSNGKVQEG